jgi:protein-tyrosine phosphatase
MPQYPPLTALVAYAFTACTVDVSPYVPDHRVSDAEQEREMAADSRNSSDDDAKVDSDDVGFDSAAGDIGPDAESKMKRCASGRRVLTDEVVNARDIGGTPLENGATVACGLLFRGAMLSSLSQRGCDAFAQLGIRTVIDLRTPTERDSSPEAKCIQEWAKIVRAPLPTPYSVSPQDYLADLYTADSIAKAFDVLGDPDAYPIYINCVHGRDRTGVVVAVILLALGATPDGVLAEYQLTREAGLSSYPDSLQAVFDEIERLGGVERYLLQMGVTRDEIDTLRSQVIVY